MQRTTAFYQTLSEQLSGIVEIDSDPAVDGKYWLARYYSELLDDDVLDAVREVTRIHLGGQRLLLGEQTTSLEFISRLRCVDSLSDYLVLALQAVVDGRAYELEPWQPVAPQIEETGHLEGAWVDPQGEGPVNLVHISDLMAHAKLNLRIPVQRFDTPPRYCFVSHAWVDMGMPDTEDGKFYRSLLLMALAVYVDTGVEHFWIDYLCVTQNPADRELQAQQLREIPGVVQRCEHFVSMCLEVYQYFGSAWCAYEALGFLAWNPRCRPADFLEHVDRKSYRFGMNVVDPTKVNANEKIIYSFTDQPFTCGVAEEQQLLTEEIERARISAVIRVARQTTRVIKAAVGMSRVDPLGLMIMGHTDGFLKASNMFDQNAKSALQCLDDVNETLAQIGYPAIPAERMGELATVLDQGRALMFVLQALKILWPGVRIRQGGAYDVPTSRLTTSYAFHNQTG